MRKKTVSVAFGLILLTQGSAHAFTVHDPLNYILNEIRNTILDTKLGEGIVLAAEKLQQLRNTYEEIVRFNEGIDEFIEGLIGDPLGDMLDAGMSDLPGGLGDSFWVEPYIETLEEGGNFHDVRDALEEITGPDPASPDRPYLTFEDYQVTQGFRLAREIREAGNRTRNSADDLRGQAQSASPKGAARIAAGGTAELMVLQQQEQEALAKLIELTATQVEQVTRKEKLLEHARLKYMQDVNDLLIDMVRP